MALALEEMGFSRFGEKSKSLFKEPPTQLVDVRTMKPINNKKDGKYAKYIMITGDPRLSPNNDFDIKAVTSENNINGEIIKVVLISQAGSEGLDFKGIRQIHILEPWYNINRIEQILGRGVRNFSHKELPFEERNVQIFLYGTLLQNSEEEAADLYIYRNAEFKAIKIGKITRLLKQTSVDCIINHDQTLLTNSHFKELEENKTIKQILSNKIKLSNFEVGDIDNSVNCDFMKCEFDCIPNENIDESTLSLNTYNESFMLVNSDKIIQKIKTLMKMRYFYEKEELIKLINVPKIYPLVQIYAALTKIIDDNSEYILDKYGRTGYLVNIGDYYLFQPSELNYKNISIYERSVPIDFKHQMIKFEIKSDIAKQVIDKRQLQQKEVIQNNDDEVLRKGKIILDTMFANYKLALETTKVVRGNDNWYQHCGIVIRKLTKNEEFFVGKTEQERLEILEIFLIEHIIDSLLMNDLIDLLNYLFSYEELEESIQNNISKRFINKTKKFLFLKFVKAKKLTGIVIFNGPSRIENLNIFVLSGKKWILADSEDKRDLEPAILQKYRLKMNLNKYVGFIGFENNKKYMVYKVKDTENKRSTGFRCDQSGKEKIIHLLNDIENKEKYFPKVTKESAFELCIIQEFILRRNEMKKLDNKTWFLDTETAIINEFEKKEKLK